MTPYLVAAFFGDPEQGQLVINAIIAPNSELAAAVTVREAARQTDADLLAVAVSPLTREFLTNALRALDGKTPESGKAEVVQLATQRQRLEGQANQASIRFPPADQRCPMHPDETIIDGGGPVCLHPACGWRYRATQYAAETDPGAA